MSVHDQARWWRVFAFASVRLCTTPVLPVSAHSRWLSGFGIVAIIPMMAARRAVFLLSGNRITSCSWRFPFFCSEMVLAVWLIVQEDSIRLKVLDIRKTNDLLETHIR